MQGKTTNLLADTKTEILALWAERARQEVDSANSVTSLTLSDSLPLFLDHLGEALATNRKVDFRSLARHDAESERIGKMHGADRAGSSSYILTEVIFEYHILRQTIFEVLERKNPLAKAEHDLILDSIEEAVNNAAVEFTEVHADVQEKFVSTLTHDIRNPLTAVKMSAELVLKRCKDDEELSKIGARIISGVNRMDSMIRDLLDASKLRAGAMLTLDLSEFNLGTAIRDAVDEMQVVHGNRFSVKADEPVVGFFWHDGIRRTIENLIGNAVKYSTPDTPILITLTKLNGFARMVVHNEGNPIAAAEQSVIFKQYRRSKSAEKSSKLGWGLGLTLVKGVAEAHRGSVRVESSAETGTNFIVELPILTQPTPVSTEVRA